MSVQASVASIALSGCPEAGAIRCRPEVAGRMSNAPQVQKLEEIVERAEAASLVQHGDFLADAYTIIETNPLGCPTADTLARNGTGGRAGRDGAMTTKTFTHPDKQDYMMYIKKKGAECLGYELHWSRERSGQRNENHKLDVKEKTFRGMPLKVDSRTPFTLDEGAFIAMGAAQSPDGTTKSVFFAVRVYFPDSPNSTQTRAYEINLAEKTDAGGQYYDIKEVAYDEAQKKFYKR